jgi:hypothetical protein
MLSMKIRRSTRVLLCVNLVLVGALLVLVLPRAGAQGQVSRPRGQYVMLGGKVQGMGTSAVYILDSVNRELIALKYDRSKTRLEPFGFRDLSVDSAAARRGK